MFSIDLLVKYTPIPISVQKKEESDARALYQAILTAMKAKEPQIIELTCDKEEDKQIAVMSDSVSGVVLAQKDGAATKGKAPGFFAAIAE